MSMNLKYSDNPLQDYKKLSTGRKLYIEKRAAKKSVSVKTYLTQRAAARGGRLLLGGGETDLAFSAFALERRNTELNDEQEISKILD
jgi:hypothetical protein